MSELRVEDRGPVRHLVIARPDRRNALTHRSHQVLTEALDAAAIASDVRCLILRGEGRGARGESSRPDTTSTSRGATSYLHARRNSTADGLRPFFSALLRLSSRGRPRGELVVRPGEAVTSARGPADSAAAGDPRRVA